METVRTEPFPQHSSSAKPEQLVLGWPADKWEGYKHSKHPEQIEAGVAQARGWLREWLEGKRKDFPGVMVYGEVGVGKSGGVLLMALDAARAGASAQFVTVEKVLIEFNSTEFTRREGDTRGVVYNRYMAPTVLVLDEMGARFYSDKERAFLLDVIRNRQGEGKVTLVTTNLQLSNETGASSEETFIAFFDGRALSTFKGWRVNATKWGPSLRGRDDANAGSRD